jgi:NAD+ synthase
MRIDPAAEVERISAHVREAVTGRFRRQGAVVGVSGGIDSAVVAFLCARALGPERVRILSMPEGESSAESVRLAQRVAESLGATFTVEDIGAILTGADCYDRRDRAIRSVVPEYGEGYRSKIVLPPLSARSRYSVYSVVTESPEGVRKKTRLTGDAYLGVVAATNFKQRARKMMEYHYADLLQYAVAGTPNRLEYELGFFVRNGDGAADIKPIAHHYKTQVYRLAEYLGVPQEIRERPPTTDTYTLDQSQEEFYFMVPLETMDLCLYGSNHRLPAERVGEVAGLEPEQVERVYDLIASGRRAALYLSAEPSTLGPSVEPAPPDR